MIKSPFKTPADFGGYWLKNIKFYKGHEQEDLFQGTIYKDGKKIGFFSEGDWGGPPSLHCDNKKDEEEIVKYGQEWDQAQRGNSWGESYGTLFAAIAEAIETVKYYRRHCRNKIIFILPEHKEGEYTFLKNKYEDFKPETIHAHLLKKHPEFLIVNEELKKLN